MCFCFVCLRLVYHMLPVSLDCPFLIGPLVNVYLEQFSDTKGEIRSRQSKKEGHCNGQMKKDKRTNNYIKNTTQKTKDRATRTPLKTEGEPHNTCVKKRLKIPKG